MHQEHGDQKRANGHRAIRSERPKAGAFEEASDFDNSEQEIQKAAIWISFTMFSFISIAERRYASTDVIAAVIA